MLIGSAICQTPAIFGMVVAFLLMFLPFTDMPVYPGWAALLGAGLGKVTGGSAKKGAVVGGVGGAVVGGSRKAGTAEENKKANQQWANEQGAEYTKKRNHYNRAFSACMEGKGYTVK